MVSHRHKKQNPDKSNISHVQEADFNKENKSPFEILKLVCLVIVVAILVGAAHWPVLSAQANSMDDISYLYENLLVRNPSWSSAGRFLTEVFRPSTVRGYYHPLTMISMMLDYKVGGFTLNLMPYHRTNMGLHIANTTLVIFIVYLLFRQIWIAGIVGLLFGLHPLTVEPVAWISERKTLLAAFFMMGSLFFYIWYTRRKSFWIYGISMVAFVLALLSKPTSFPVPALMLILDYWPLRRLNKWAVVEKLPFFVIGGISVFITLVSQGLAGAVDLPSEYGVMEVPLIICHNIVFYLSKIIWPAPLSPYYPFPEPLNLSQPIIAWSVIGTLVLIGLLLVSLKWTKALLAGALFYLVALFPTMGVVRFAVVIASDKYVYLPSLGLLMVLTWFFTRWWTSKGKFSNLIIRRTVLVVIVALLGLCEAVATRRYLVYWQDTVTLWQYMAKMAPQKSLPHSGLASVFLKQGRIDDAIKEYNQALELEPSDYAIHHGLAMALTQKNEIDQAIEYYFRSLAINPNLSKTHSDLGVALLKKGKTEQALDHFRTAVQLKPDSYKALNNLAWVLATSKDPKLRNPTEALKLAQTAGKIYKYKQADLLDTLAVAYAANSQFDKAVETGQMALAIALFFKNEAQAEALRSRLSLYKAGKAYYE